ncbi:hypothetical protein Trco_000148 [Trichoderma cornu-damae]|uniref:NAD-specific glutamate dehydrogenase n=1 Tax=Trichoderma cornu-damae TaxID=654480 RepID=A0A9P8QVM8_9HYPO|nr:hypothetical protein Trco_000148 [Trichoderma cornu-damae]
MCHDVGLGRGQLGLLLVGDNLVAHGVELIILIVIALLETRAGALALDPVVAGRSHFAVHDGPDFLGQVLGELGGVGDDDNTTLELLEGLGQSAQRVTIQVVCRLVEDDQVGSLPRAGSQDSLDALAAGQTAHAGVGDQLGIEAEVGAVGLNLLSDQRPELTRGEGLLHIDIGNHLLVRGQQLVTRQPDVVGSHHGHPPLVLHADVLAQGERTLVLVAVLELSAGVDANDTALSALDLEDLVHGLLVGLGDDLVGSVHGLAVLASLETPLDVLGRSLVEVVVNVGEGVLLDVGNTDVLVLVNLTAGGDELTAQDVDQGGLAGTVGANDGNTRAQRALEGDVGDLGLGGAGVLEGHLGGAEDGLGLGLDTLEEAGLGEGELDLGGAELVVGLGGRNTLDELLQVTSVTPELEALVVNDVLADVVEEARVVRDDDGGAGGVDEVVLEPLDVLHVQVVGGLVKEQDVGGLEDGTAQGELHLPTTGQGGDLALDHLLGEAELVQALLDVGLGDADLGLGKLLHGPVNGGHLSVGGVEVVLDEDGLDFALLGEALDLLVVDGTHESGLAGTVGAAEAVALAALEAEVGLVKQNLGAVGKGEGAVAKVLTLLLVGLDLLLLGGAGRSTLAESLDGTLGVVNAGDDGNVRLEVLNPDGGLGLLHVDELAGHGGNVLGDGAHLLKVGGVAGGQDLLELGEDDADIAVVADLGDLAVLDVADAVQGVEGLLGLLTGLGVGQVVEVLLETRHHLGQEGSDDVGVVDKLAHVVDDDGGLSLDGGLTLSKTTIQKRDHEREGGFLDLGDEGGGTEKVDSLGDVLRLGDTLDELRNEALDILVDNQLADALHGLVGVLLDLLLGVPHGLGDNGDQVGDAVGELSRGSLDEGEDEVQSSHLFGPLLSVADGLHQVGQSALDGVAVDGAGNGQDGSGSSILDGSDLVANGGKQAGQKNDEVGLDVGSDLGRNESC